MPQGTIKKLIADKGFGFIDGERGDLFFHHSAVEGASIETLQVGQHAVGDVLVGLGGELHPLDVELLGNQPDVFFQPRLVRCIGQHDFDQRERLANLELRSHPSAVARRHDLADEGHALGKLLVDLAKVSRELRGKIGGTA